MRAVRRSQFPPFGLGLAVVVVVVVLIVVLTRSSTPPLGYDISYPQCGSSYPSNALFGVIGVNGGVASDANRCLASELAWAREAPGQKRPRQTRLSFYIDTGDPGQRSAAWPRGGTAPVYGPCNGLLTNSCSYLYGEQRAEYSYRLAAAIDPAAARTAPWWLDVELLESWAGTYQLNVAALQGFLAGLRTAGATGQIGVYSTAAQWQELTGLTARTTATTLHAQLAGWVAGGDTTLAQARQNCATAGFTGVAPTLAQYRRGPFDVDLPCPRTR